MMRVITRITDILAMNNWYFKRDLSLKSGVLLVLRNNIDSSKLKKQNKTKQKTKQNKTNIQKV